MFEKFATRLIPDPLRRRLIKFIRDLRDDLPDEAQIEIAGAEAAIKAADAPDTDQSGVIIQFASIGKRPEKKGHASTGKSPLSGWKHGRNKPACSECGAWVRLVVAYIGPLALNELLKEGKHVRE